MDTPVRQLLCKVQSGEVSVDEALTYFKSAPFEDLGYAKVDLHRRVRQGMAEVIFAQGKTAAQISGILESMRQNGQRVLITRLDEPKANEIQKTFPITYLQAPHIGYTGEIPEPDGLGTVVVATGGTGDIPVAEEAAVTAEWLGNRVQRLYDVGVAGLHRLLAFRETLMNASVIIAAAGMEGALASVIGGMTDCPVIALPTGVGYGSSFHGLSALLSMLNSCAGGVGVVNIDNGFGAGVLAHRINHMTKRE